MKPVGINYLMRLCATLCCLLTAQVGLFTAAVVYAETDHSADLDDIYTIELVVFANQSTLNAQLAAGNVGNVGNVDEYSGPGRQERWDNDYELSYPESLVFLKTPAEIDALQQAALQAAAIEEADSLDALLSGNQQAEGNTGSNEAAPVVVPPLLMQLDTRQYETHSIARPIDRRSAHRVLFHQVWHQKLIGRKAAPALVVKGGKRFDDHYELEGSITFSKGRYLHINTDLWLSQYIEKNSWQAANSIPAAIPLQPVDPELNIKPVSAGDEPGAATGAGETDTAFKRDKLAFINQNRAAMQRYQPLYTYVLREYRKSRRDEVHYLDHPMFGIIVKIGKYQLAEAGRE